MSAGYTVAAGVHQWCTPEGKCRTGTILLEVIPALRPTRCKSAVSRGRQQERDRNSGDVLNSEHFGQHTSQAVRRLRHVACLIRHFIWINIHDAGSRFCAPERTLVTLNDMQESILRFAEGVNQPIGNVRIDSASGVIWLFLDTVSVFNH